MLSFVLFKSRHLCNLTTYKIMSDCNRNTDPVKILYNLILLPIVSQPEFLGCILTFASSIITAVLRSVIRALISNWSKHKTRLFHIQLFTWNMKLKIQYKTVLFIGPLRLTENIKLINCIHYFWPLEGKLMKLIDKNKTGQQTIKDLKWTTALL